MKKIFSILGALLAGAMMFSCSEQYEEEIVTFGTEISASVESLAEFAAENAEDQTFEVTANGEWVVVAPSWLEITPRTGKEGTTTITVVPTNNYMMVEKEDGTSVQELGYAREATIQIAGEQDIETPALAEVAVTQAGDPNKVYTGPEKISVADFIAKADGKTVYELTGTVTRVANTYYGNFDLTDETGTIYIYGLLDAEGEKCYEANGIKLGDTITVQGTYTLYGTTHEIVNATYISHEEGGPVEIMPSSIGDFLEAANPSQLYELTGVVKNITGEEYGNFDLVDATGSVYVYGLLTEEGGANKQFASLDIQEGDILTLVGNYATYKEQAQVGSAYHVSHIDVSAKTVAEFLAAEEGSDYYMLTGTIANLKDGDKYGNLDLVDETGSVYVYGVHVGYGGSNGQFQQLVEAHGLKNGDTLTIIGQRGSYNGQDQVVKGFYYSHVSNSAGEGGGEEPEQPTIVDATVAEFIAAAEDDTQYRVQGVVTQIVKAEYGNVYIKDATGEVYVYGIGAKGEFETMGIEVGDIVTLVSVRASYNGAAQLNAATLESKIDVTAKTVAEFLATEESSENYYMLTGTVDTVGDGDKYGNFNITDESASVYVYGMLAGWGGSKGQFQTTVANTGLKSGDTLTIIGTHSSYNGTPQVGGGFYFSHESVEVVEPELPEGAVQEVIVMSEQFSEATSFVSGQTYTWGSFDFTFTQNNSSTSNYNAGDAGVRFYQSDVLAVNGGNKVISKIEFTTYGGKTGPFTADCGTMTANTVWEGESSTVTFTASAQVRFSKITIIYTEGEGGEGEGEGEGGEATAYTMTLNSVEDADGVYGPSSNISGLEKSFKEHTWTATDDSGVDTITFSGNVYYRDKDACVWYFNKKNAGTTVAANGFGTLKKITLTLASSRLPDSIVCTDKEGNTIASTETEKSSTITWEFANATDGFSLLSANNDDTNSTYYQDLKISTVVIEYEK